MEILKEKDKPKKKRKKSLSRLRKILWEWFTKYIKLRDNYTCITCGKVAQGQGMGGGHYKPKGACNLTYYFSEVNVNAQCTYCNLTLQGNQVVYRERLIQKFGLEAVLDIEQNFRKPTRDFPFEEKIEYYKNKVLN
jgi:hypothetical protein